jgi:hypothetical protein
MTDTKSDTPRTEYLVKHHCSEYHAIQLCRQLERELAECRKLLSEASKDVEHVLIATAHYHVQSQDGNDTCKECGLNLRNKIHFPKYIDLRRAAIKEQPCASKS